MPDVLRKVRSGDDLAIPASVYNSMLDVVAAHRAGELSGGAAARGGRAHAGLVLVKNGSGHACPRLAVLGIDSPLFDPAQAASLERFKATPAVVGVTPLSASHAGRFVVLAEPLAAGAVGWGHAAGVCPVWVNVTDAGHGYADVANGSRAALASGTSGEARILWKEAGTGLSWSLIRIGQQPAATGGGATLAKIVSSTAPPAGEYSLLEQAPTGTGTFGNKAGAVAFTAYNLAELTLGTGAALDAGTLVLATLVPGSPDTWVFDHPVYAKYLN